MQAPRLTSCHQVTLVDDPKANADVNSAKAMALDHLGAIAFKLYSIANGVPPADEAPRLQPLSHVSVLAECLTMLTNNLQIMRRQSCADLRSLAEREAGLITIMHRLFRHEMSAEVRWCRRCNSKNLTSMTDRNRVRVSEMVSRSATVHSFTRQ